MTTEASVVLVNVVVVVRAESTIAIAFPVCAVNFPATSTVEARAIVGLPATPSPLDTAIWLAVPVIVRPVNVSAAVCVTIPLVL